MKKTLLGIACFFAYIVSIQAQTLYGTTFNGGNDGAGTINKFTPATNNLAVSKSFESYASNPYYGNFIQALDGKLYGMTFQGGSLGDGIIFSFDPSSSTYTKLKNFDNVNGGFPAGSLIQASNGSLYGMTLFGGANDIGVIFSFDPSSLTYTKLRDFDDANGAGPSGSLIQATNGKFYGLTGSGGSNGVGVIFSFDPSSSTYTKLEDFNNTNGSSPSGSLMQGNDGKLYGMTVGGGNNSLGVIFSFDPSSSTYTKLKDFDGIGGATPYGSLMQASNGKLYGMTLGGGNNSRGVIFSFDPSNSIYTKLKDFDDTNGASPYGNLIQASDGKLYGTTYGIGDSDVGVIFSFDPSNSNYVKLEDFDNAHGANPYGSLMQAGNGKLYGMTLDGGINGDGVIFSFDPPTSTYTMLKDFSANESGRNPSGSLMRASDGKLYGLISSGGKNDVGAIFSFNPSSLAYTKLKDFDNANGANPFGNLMRANNGKLYGMTLSGGNNDVGVIFSFDPSSATYTKLKDFDNVSGASPYGSLIQASNGKLYGMTNGGGTGGYGVIFSFDPSSATYTKVKDFDYTGGASPYGSLMQAKDGKLYGMTNNGGEYEVDPGQTDAGVIFSFDPSTSTYTKMMDFGGDKGAFPYGNLIQAKDGKLYGTTYGGGSSDAGVIFSFDPSSSAYKKLKDYDGGTGANPYGSLMQSSKGKLYGMTSLNIFSYDPSSSVYADLKSFDGANGADPYFGSAFIEAPESGSLPVTLVSFTGKNAGNNNQLSWKVDNELNLNYYELQRSIDGQNFKGITQVKAEGNNNYNYTDHIAVAVSSLYYYRLKSVDKDGSSAYSIVIKLRTYRNGFAVINPNPFKDRLVVNVESAMRDKVTFIITDISGRQLYKENKLLSAGINVIEINETGKFSKGAYLLTIIESQQSQSIKVIKGN